MADTAPSSSSQLPPQPPPEPDPKPEGLFDLVQGLFAELPALVSDRVDLLALELQRASRSLAQIVALVVAAAILGVTAWLALWAGIAAGLTSLGLHWGWAMAVVMLANLLAAWWAVTRVRALAPQLGLPATRRSFTLRQGPSHTSTPAADEHHATRAAA